jgi:electron transfer flavoprotein alpha subunit
VSALATPRAVAVLDGSCPGVERRARALAGFLRDGLRLDEDALDAAAEAVTLAFYADDSARDRLVELAPTTDVRLIRAPAFRADLMTAALTAFEAGGSAGLFLFPGGPLGAELAARLAARAGGGVLTDVLYAAAGPARLLCRRAAYSNHLTGRFELRPRPWCVTLDAVWYDARVRPAAEHSVRTDIGQSAGGAPLEPVFDDVELLEPPSTGDLEAAEFLVVAGRGALGRGGVERIAAAAARMGAAFGVTRPVAMNAWAPADRQLGVSGVRAAPAVCIVAGASGAPAFLWGVEQAGFIAAVDTDERAAIVAEADAVVIDDAVAVVEALAEIVAREHSS